MEPLVSVVTVTYQHAPFIEQCVGGVLMQKKDFAVEHLIGEDGSTDGTKEICQMLAERHPASIRLFLRDRRDVMYIMGRATGRSNFLGLLASARGKYIALCDGDDHWTEPLKLQRQVTMLEADPTAVGCFTNALNERDGASASFFGSGYAHIPNARVSERDIIKGQGIPTCTLLFRAHALYPLPAELSTSPVGDTILFTHLARLGDLVYLPEVTAVRAMHAGGAHSLKDKLHRVKVQEAVLPLQDRMTEGRYSTEIRARMTVVYWEAWSLGMKNKDLRLLRYLWPRMATRRKDYEWGIPTTIRHWLKAWAPALDRLVAVFRG